MINFPSLCIGIQSTGNENLITFASLPGREKINEDEKIIGRFSLTSNIPFSGSDLKIEWNFDSSFSTILTAENFSDITNPEYHFNFLGITTGADDLPHDLQYSLKQNYPNPFNPSTKIHYTVPENGELKLVIYNLLVETIRTLINSSTVKGEYITVWNGLNNKGEEVSSGVYFYELVFSQRDEFSKGETTFKDI